MVERVCHSGLPPAEVERFRSRLHDHAGIPAEPLAVAVAGAPGDVPHETLAAAAALLLHGAPLPGCSVRPMDLLPAAVQRVSRPVLALASLAAVSGVAGVASLLLAQGTVQATTRAVSALEQEFAQLVADAGPRAALLERASELQPRRATLDRLQDRAGNPVQPLLETLLLLPPEATLASAALDAPPSGERPARLDLRLAADFSGPGGAALRRDFTSALAARPWCDGLHLVQGGLRAGPDGRSESLGVGLWLR
jgi:hypothetical protein